MAEINRYNKSRLEVEDQWASHPPLTQRLHRIEQMAVTTRERDQRPVSLLLRHAERYKKELTDLLFAPVPYQGEVITQSSADFSAALEEDFGNFSFSPLYNGYYDDYLPQPFALEKSAKSKPASPEVLFSDEMENLVYEVIGLENDMEGLQYIVSKDAGVKTFNYDGKKYKQKDCALLLVQCRKELLRKKAILKENDIAIYHYFHSLTMTDMDKQRLDIRYEDLFKAAQEL
ncbi:hypothetical protein AB9P05_00060 [Roseivirga sp. BDSF3-8]|uniref:hypothetical protein n=1 Tax=Roseivirga sp. BDSF3-8 TaxID=3241598 RepID=UPI00353204D0